MYIPNFILWFRQDLRLSDNPALIEAAQNGAVLPIYILDDENAAAYKMGGASRWWLHHSLHDLNLSLGGNLRFYYGDAHEIITDLVKSHDIKGVYWNRCYEPWRISRDKKIKNTLGDMGVECHSFKASLLWEPWEIKKSDGTPYKVFTPFYRKGCLSAPPPRAPLPAPNDISFADTSIQGMSLTDLKLLPTIGWDAQLAPHWNIGEIGAQKRLYEFLDNGMTGYKEGRNFPAQTNVSRLSPHLHFGEISPYQAWHSAIEYGHTNDSDTFMSELGWREFSHSLLYHFPELPHKNWQSKFDSFPWEKNDAALLAWQRGQTGIPIIDAGMRELWQTGYMHNRVRMIVGSFLVKNLLLHWGNGERWFWDTLLDADLANNSASWQWVAGCGADAAPYFRIFNPVTQGQKFDVDGRYTRHYVPELAHMPDKYLFNPWEAPKEVLSGAKVLLGKTYPHPIIDLKASRERALAAFKTL